MLGRVPALRFRCSDYTNIPRTEACGLEDDSLLMSYEQLPAVPDSPYLSLALAWAEPWR